MAIGCASSAENPGNETPGFAWDAGLNGSGNHNGGFGGAGQVPVPATCTGNGVVDPPEQCDGPVPNGMTCSTATMGSLPIGNLKCTGCQIDTSGCSSNGVNSGAGGGVGTGTGGGQGSAGYTGSSGTTGGGGTTAVPTPPGNMDPVIPPSTQTCPQLVNSTITFMGLGGIQIVAGAAPPSPTAPLVFYWHGTGSTSGEFAALATAVQQGVVQEGGVLVSFQNTTGGDLLSGTSIFGAGDFKLADELAACAVKDHNVDPRRIFTMGCSAGGLFSAAMAAERSAYIAAAAPNSGGWVAPVPWENGHTPALMTVHGAPGSDVVVVDFSQTSTTADTAFKGRGGFVIDCNTGGGHCGGGGLAPDVWTFFKAHPFGVSPEPWSALPSGFSTECTIK